MKKTIKKTLILGLVIGMAVAGILAFYQTIVVPPTDVPVKNLHKLSIEANINEFSGEKSIAFNDSIYDIVIYKFAMYRNEGFMTDDEIDFQKKALVDKYLPIFAKQSNSKFEASVWEENDHQKMLDRITHLRNLRVDNGTTSAVTGSYETNLQSIENIINNYRKAKEVAKLNSYTTVEKAKKDIEEAEKYRTMYPLSNCKKLVEKLADVKSRIGKSHYYFVKSRVYSLANYDNMTKQEFKELEDKVKGYINEYNKNRYNYGNDAEAIDELNKMAYDYHNNAVAYYNRKISIYTNNQWTENYSSASSYREFQSYSNRYIDNKDAVMLFTIKGYESFTFKIACNSEIYDYVLVGINYAPTTSKNYTYHHGGYKEVSLYNLNKNSEYTIYVVYHKNGSVSSGNDRGYVRIPKK